jgi:hypothetical protein
MITITHTRAAGTLVEGSQRGDGVYEILHGLHGHWRPFRSLGCLGLVQSRDKLAKTWLIDSAAAALRAAGHEVTVSVDDTAPGREVAEIETDRAQRAGARADRYAERSQRRGAEADAAYARARQMAEAIPIGQPVLSDHYSARTDRNYRARMGRTYDRAFEGMAEAERLAQRAQAAEANQSHRESIPATLRRIERLEAEERQLQRRLNGTGLALHGEDTPATGAYAERLSVRLADIADELTYWRDHVKAAEESGVKVWSCADFAKGDYVRHGGRWYQVERVNAKSLSVPHGINDHELRVVTRAEVRHAMGPSQWVAKVTYDEVTGRKSADEMAAALAEMGA